MKGGYKMNKINYFVLGIVCTVLIASMFSVASAKWSLFKSSDDARLSPDSTYCQFDRATIQAIIQTTTSYGNRDVPVQFIEERTVFRGTHVVVQKALLKVISIYNATTGYADDYVDFKDVATGQTTKALATSEGVGTVVIRGDTYGFTYSGASTAPEDERTVRLNYPSSSDNDIVDMSVCF